MKTLTILFLLLFNFGFSQKNVELIINSKALDENRTVDIHIPKSYAENNSSYPVIYCLDGEYAQTIVNGTIDYYAFWKKIPECIVVSIRQNYRLTDSTSYKRWSDCGYIWKTGLLNQTGEKFKQFIENELIPKIESEYRTTPFRAIIGHSFTANYVNYFLLDSLPKFKAYISISPYYTKNMFDTLKNRLENLSEPISYFTTYGENDLTGHQKSVKGFDKIFSSIENENFNYSLYNLKGNEATHFTIFPKSLPIAIEHIFSSYNIISKREFKKLLTIENKVEYLSERYKNIEKLYGVGGKVRENDFNTVARATYKKKQWGQMKDIGDWCIKEYPNIITGYDILGLYEEKKKDYEKALYYYQKGFSLLGDDITNKEVFKKDSERVKKKIKK